MRKYLLLTSIALLCFNACNQPKPNENKPSGLKNMAPVAISDQVFDDLDKEPNNTFIQATDVKLTGDELNFTGKLTPGDIDTWRIIAKAGTIVDITVQPENFDVIVDFSPIDKESARRYYDENAVSEPETLTNLRLTPQGGYLTVRGRNTEEVSYKINVVRLFPQGDEILEQEPNDTTAAAQPIWTDRELNATLNPADDVDVYKLNLNKPGIFNCSFTSEPAAVKILQGNQVLFRSETKPGEAFKSQPLKGSADLFAQIERLAPSKAPVHYSCRLTALDSIPNEIEPNNTPNLAQKIDIKSNTLEFSFENAADIDMFRATAETNPPQTYSIRLEADNEISATLNILDASGSPLAQGTGPRACLFTPATGQDFIIRTAHAPSTHTYPISYRLRVSSLNADSVEREPNNMMAQATALPLDKPISGYVFPNTDIDFYKIEIPSQPGDALGRLDVTTESGYIAQLNLKLMDSAGFEISRAESKTASKPVMLSFDAPAGSYLLAVSGQGDQCIKPYTLKATYTLTPAQTAPSAEAAYHDAAEANLAALQPAPSPEGILVPAAPDGTPQVAPEQPVEVDINALLKAAQEQPAQAPAKAATPDDDAF